MPAIYFMLYKQILLLQTVH